MKSGKVVVKKDEAFFTGDGWPGLVAFDVAMAVSSCNEMQREWLSSPN